MICEMAQISYSFMFGGGGGTMNLDELQVLEKNLEFWIYHIRSTKVFNLRMCLIGWMEM